MSSDLIPEAEHGKRTIFLNGRARQVTAHETLGSLALGCDLEVKRLLVELNGQTLMREEWPSRTLSHGDRVEFIRVVAGG